VPFQEAMAQAKQKGIVVNTVHCGSAQQGAQGQWPDGAKLAGGQSFNIDQNRAVAHIAAPQDDEIARLGVELNKTYLGYGRSGDSAKKRQEAQDTNAGASIGSATTRAVSKASRLYDNSGWDLVDGTKQGKVKVEEMKEEELPAELRGKSATERKALVDAKAKEREALQARIQKLDQERRKYVADKQKAQAAEGADTLDQAILKSVRTQAEAQSFTLE
jgi:hypothetical protein